MKYRHEVKCEITESDFYVLRQRLKAVMKPDAHTENGVYKIRSLYFDTPEDKALKEKIDGVALREKWRFRLYNNDTSMIRLERKFKNNSLGSKMNARLTKEQALSIVKGDVEWMAESDNETLLLFYSRLKSERLKPSMSSVGCPYDNACAENFFSMLKTECIYRAKPQTFDEAKELVDEYIYFYNNERIQLKTKLTPLEMRSQYVA